jgi:hypothetical protein
MVKQDRRLGGLLLPLALVGIVAFAAVAMAQKKVIVQTRAYTPPNLSVSADPNVITVCEGGGPAIVQLNARATSDYPIRYRWTTNGGRITGDGATVSWDLSGVQPGYYRASLDIDTGSGDEACQAFASTTVIVKRCPPVVPVCPNVSISCPERGEVGQPLTFSSNLSGGTPGVNPIYNWTVSAGRILDGQGTPTITVDTTGLAGQTVTATLSMGGYTLDCSASCSVQFPAPLECRKFDEYENIPYNDEKARLDNYGIELQNDPTATAFVIVYPGQGGKANDVQRHTSRVVDYLVNSRGITAQRIVTVVGPARDKLLVELWLCPQGAKPPNFVR